MKRYIRPGLGLAGLVLLAYGAYLGLAWAPPDRDMGDVQRIMYAHVPAVWAALLALIVQFVACVVYLFNGSWKVDALAEATAEVGVVLGTVGVLLGAIWGRPTWGVWWAWDPRLTTAAILIVAYLGVLALRKFVEDPERRATWSAVAGIIAFVDLPIVWFSVKWWRSLHQVQSTASSVDPQMRTALLVNAIAVLLVGAWFVWERYRIALRDRHEEIALPEALPELSPSPEVRGVAR
jgi:heme exporter protein C